MFYMEGDVIDLKSCYLGKYEIEIELVNLGLFWIFICFIYIYGL